jgi:hypothetical protein
VLQEQRAQLADQLPVAGLRDADGPGAGRETTKNAPAVSGAGGPNIFRDPVKALSFE